MNEYDRKLSDENVRKCSLERWMSSDVGGRLVKKNMTEG